MKLLDKRIGDVTAGDLVAVSLIVTAAGLLADPAHALDQALRKSSLTWGRIGTMFVILVVAGCLFLCAGR